MGDVRILFTADGKLPPAYVWPPGACHAFKTGEIYSVEAEQSLLSAGVGSTSKFRMSLNVRDEPPQPCSPSLPPSFVEPLSLTHDNTPLCDSGILMKTTYNPAPTEVMAFKLVTPSADAGAIRKVISGARTELSPAMKLLVISETPGDTDVTGKPRSCYSYPNSDTPEKYTLRYAVNDPEAPASNYCHLDPGKTYYVNVSSEYLVYDSVLKKMVKAHNPVNVMSLEDIEQRIHLYRDSVLLLLVNDMGAPQALRKVKLHRATGFTHRAAFHNQLVIVIGTFFLE